MISQEEIEKIIEEYSVGDRPYSKEIELVLFNGTATNPLTMEQMRLFATTIKMLRDNGIQISIQRSYQRGEHYQDQTIYIKNQ
jgi:hypothetical protein